MTASMRAIDRCMRHYEREMGLDAVDFLYGAEGDSEPARRFLLEHRGYFGLLASFNSLREAERQAIFQLKLFPPMPDSGATKLSPRESAEDRS